MKKNTNIQKDYIPIEYSLETYHRSNQDTCMVHKPAVSEGDWVQAGDLLADCSASVGGELSLGQNILVAYMPWEGYNYEDAILLSERLVYDDVYTSIHIEKYEIETTDTKYGAEQITANVPDVSQKDVLHLEKNGIAKLGTFVKEGDILVGKITPINKKSQSPFQKLLYTILQKEFIPFRDSSLRAPKGLKGKVMGIQIFSSQEKNKNSKIRKGLPSKPEVLGRQLGQFFASSSEAGGTQRSGGLGALAISPFGTKLREAKTPTAPTASLAPSPPLREAKARLYTSTTAGIRYAYFFASSPTVNKGEIAPKVVFASPLFTVGEDAKQGSTKNRSSSDIALRNEATRGEGAALEELRYRSNSTGGNATKSNNIKKVVGFSYTNLLKFKEKKEVLFQQPATSSRLLRYVNVAQHGRRALRSSNWKASSSEADVAGGSRPFVAKLTAAVGAQRSGGPTAAKRWSSFSPTAKKAGAVQQGAERGLGAPTVPTTQELQLGTVRLRRDKEKKKPSKSSTASTYRTATQGAPKISSIQKVHIYLAEKRKIGVGDKMAGRHGNKGIVSQILPRQDMPYLPDGTPIDMVLNPLGVPSRMNVGQIYECLLGLAGKQLGLHFRVPPFDEIYGPEASRSFVYSKLYEARKKTGNEWLFDPNFPGKIRVFDGRTGDCFDQAITVGQSYMLKLVHLVDDKIHVRSTGPYSLVTQQPLRGRSKQGGQRLGEMEVWALEGYGAAFTLLEMLTIKSDNISGRLTLWSNIILNKNILIGTPESFKVLVSELQALCLNIGLFRTNAHPAQSILKIEDLRNNSLKEISHISKLP